MAGLGTFLLEVGVDVNALQQGLNNAESKLTSFGKKAEQIGTKLSITLSAPLALIAKNALSASGEFESLQVSFGVMLRSMDKGKQLMQDIQKFNLSTPFQFDEVAGASKSLLAFGFAQQQIIPNLRMIGDLSSALGINIKELADIYGKAKVQGRLFSEDINQLTGRGIPIIAELAKQFGTTEDKIKGLVESGKIGFGNLERAFVSMTSKGGQFYDMTAKQSETLKGVMSNFSDSVTQSLASLGDSIVKNLDLKSTLNQVSSVISDLTAKFKELSPEAQKAILAVGGIAIVVPPLLALAGTILPMIGSGFLAMISPAGLASTALATAAIYAVSHWEKMEEILYRVKKGVQDTLLGIGLAGTMFQEVVDKNGANVQRENLLAAYAKNVGENPAYKNQIKKEYQSNKSFMYKKGEKPLTEAEIKAKAEADKKAAAAALAKLDQEKQISIAKQAAEAIKKIKDDLLNATYQAEINQILDTYAKQKAEAEKSYKDDVKAKMEAVQGKKGLEDEYANYVTQRYKELQVQLRKIEQEEFKTPSLINRKMITGVQNSLNSQQKGVGDKFTNSLENTLAGGVKSIDEEGLKGRIENLLGIAQGTINNVNFDEYKNKAQTVLDANKSISDSLKELAVDAIANMSMIVGQMIAGTATMADLGKMLTSVMSQALMDIAKVNIAAGLASLIPSVGPLKLVTGIAAGIGAGILGGIGNKKQSNSNYAQQMQYSVIRGGDIFTANNRYQTIKGF